MGKRTLPEPRTLLKNLKRFLKSSAMNLNVIFARKVYRQKRVDAADARKCIIVHVTARKRIGLSIRLNVRLKEQKNKSLSLRKQ